MEALCGSVMSHVAHFRNPEGATCRISQKTFQTSAHFCQARSRRSLRSKQSSRSSARLNVVASSAEVKETEETVGSANKLDVLIESENGVSYEVLENKLAAGLWEEADAETRRLICVLAGEGAAKRKWVYFTEVQYIPVKDLLTIDRLWRAYSKDRFGFSVQRRMWKNLDRRFKPFFLEIGWTFGENSTYKKFPMDFTWDIAAPIGHLPLTNALRGTQLIEKLFTHPAFEVFDAEETMPETSVDVPVLPSTEDSKPNLSQPSGGSIFDEGFNSSDYGF